MPPLPEGIISVLSSFEPVFSTPVCSHAQTLLVGAILCRGRRTVSGALEVLGLGHENRFEKYHRALNRARWSGLQASRILLGLLVSLLPPQWPIIMGVDETIERRRGRKIPAKGTRCTFESEAGG